MAKQDLTTLQRVRGWLAIADNITNSDGDLSREISRISATTLGWLRMRTLLNVQYNDVLSGVGQNRIVIKNRPVTSIISLAQNGTTIPANPQQPGQGSGYTLVPWDGYDPAPAQQLILSGYCFQRGFANIQLSYMAGYMKALDPMVIPAGSPWQLYPEVNGGLFAADMGVTINGVAAVPVASSPTAGQYVPANLLTPNDATGKAVAPNYSFAAVDAGKAVVITASYVPLTIENAVCELVGERWRYRDRIGARTKTLGGQETMAYDPNDFPLWFKTTLQPYRLMVPL